MTGSYILSPKESDDATFTTGTSTVSDAGVTNLQNARPNNRCRFSSTTAHVVIDFGSAVVRDTLVLGWVKLDASDATFQLRAATSEGDLTASPGYDSGPITVWPSGSDLSRYLRPHRSFEFIAQTFRWWRIDINDGSSTYGHIELSRLMLGERIEPDRSLPDPLSNQGEEPAPVLTSRGGEGVAQFRGFYNQMPASWPFITEADHANMWSTFEERGAHGDIALVTKPESIYPMLYIRIGRVTSRSISTNEFVNDDGDRFRSARIVVSEFAPTEMT